MAGGRREIGAIEMRRKREKSQGRGMGECRPHFADGVEVAVGPATVPLAPSFCG
jgi:hypothetical protein